MYYVKSLIKPSTLLKYKLKNSISCDTKDELSNMLFKIDNTQKNENEYTKLKLRIYKDYLLVYYLQSNKRKLS